MHETDAFRKECKTEVIAKWWMPGTMNHYADHLRDGRFTVWHDGVAIGSVRQSLLESSDWCKHNGYVRLGDCQ